MKASEVKPLPEAILKPWSPNRPTTCREYAVAACGTVISPTRYATAEDAYFYGVLIHNHMDREKCGHIILPRKVVSREVTFGEWETVDEGEIKL